MSGYDLYVVGVIGAMVALGLVLSLVSWLTASRQ
jgi:hypothetical protein